MQRSANNIRLHMSAHGAESDGAERSHVRVAEIGCVYSVHGSTVSTVRVALEHDSCLMHFVVHGDTPCVERLDVVRSASLAGEFNGDVD